MGLRERMALIEGFSGRDKGTVREAMEYMYGDWEDEGKPGGMWNRYIMRNEEDFMEDLYGRLEGMGEPRHRRDEMLDQPLAAFMALAREIQKHAENPPKRKP